jgi:cytochrome c biogenesis protein CcmG/thiol:disulfide interchange protein DsbE
MKSRFLPALLFFSFASFALAAPSTSASMAMLGRRAPGFTLPDSAGGYVELAGLQHGSVVIVTVVASWSPLCRAAMPELVEFAASHPELAFVGVAISEVHGPDGVGHFIDQYRIPFPIAMGNEMFEHLYRTNLAPTMFVIDRQGIIRSVLAGNDARVDQLQLALRALPR